MSLPVETAKALFQAFVDKNRDAAESLIDADFRFTSPLDNGLDRAAYFETCWPNSKVMIDVSFIALATDADRAFVTYEARTTGGRRFRNTEVLTVRAGRIIAVEVYFGWNLPHDVPAGEHRDPAAA